MKLRPRRPDDVDVNITPLIDVVFLLLIFFMVSTTFKDEFEVSLDLPEASSDTRMAEKLLELTIDATGQYYLNRKKVVNTQMRTLMRALQKEVGQRNLPLIISADAKTPHQSVIIALDAARQIGLTRITFATKQPDN